MSDLFVIRGRLQELYAQYSMFIDKGLQFAMAFLTFLFISQNVGFMKAVASTFVIFVLAVLCTFVPTTFTVLMSAGLVLVHMYKLSLGVFIVTAIIYIIMFICYFKFSPKYGAIILLVPIAFYLKVPYVIPLACGLLGGPSLIVPVTFGTIIYFMITYIKTSASVLTGVEEIIPQMSMLVQQLIENKELWITVIAFSACILVVFTIRMFSVDHAWFMAIVAGGIVNIVVMAAGSVMFNTKVSYGMLFIGGILAILCGFVLELFVFAVDYSRSERLQFEDDEYCYYVKAIPKISIAVPKKTVKHISDRQFGGRNTDDDEYRTDRDEDSMSRKFHNRQMKNGKKRNRINRADPDTVLFEQSMKKDLDL